MIKHKINNFSSHSIKFKSGQSYFFYMLPESNSKQDQEKMVKNRRPYLEPVRSFANNCSSKNFQSTKNPQILHQDYWLTSDAIDMASYLLAKDHMDIDGFQ